VSGEPRRRLLDALERMGPDAATVLAPLPDEPSLVMAGIIDAPSAELEARWRAEIAPVFARLDLPMPPAASDPERGRSCHSDAFRWLHGEFTSVRRLDPGATW
jgi:1,2-phenylacetyl-CoA epoxidase catalytic subunit